MATKKSVPSAKTNIFSDEDIKSFVELGEVLRRIRSRLISEGYVIKDGKISKPILEQQKVESETKLK